MTESEVRAYCARIRRATDLAVKRMQEVSQKELKKNNEKIIKEFAPIYKEIIRKLFKEAVTDFYNDFDVKYYDRNGDPGSESGGLYDILQIKDGKLNWPTYGGVDDLYNKGAAKGRNGYGLFDKVFMQGWHGGAEGGNGHPSPGTPYYRARYVEKKPHFTEWSRAAKSSTPPNDTFDEKLTEAEGNEIKEKFIVVMKKNRGELAAKLQQQLNNIIAAEGRR